VREQKKSEAEGCSKLDVSRGTKRAGNCFRYQPKGGEVESFDLLSNLIPGKGYQRRKERGTKKKGERKGVNWVCKGSGIGGGGRKGPKGGFKRRKGWGIAKPGKAQKTAQEEVARKDNRAVQEKSTRRTKRRGSG